MNQSEFYMKKNNMYIPEIKCMLAENLYDKNGNIVKMPRGSECPPPPVGWWASEKLDGVRAIWDGSRFISRNKKVFTYVPDFIIKSMPTDIKLDGELWMGRNNFNKISSISNWIPGNKYTRDEIDNMWKEINYAVFDVYNSAEKFEKRVKIINDLTSGKCTPFIKKINRTLIESLEHLEYIFLDITSSGGEGVILNAPNSLYINRRTKYILKHKIISDAEGLVIERIPGEGRLSGLLGSIKVRIIKGDRLTDVYTNIGTGFNDEERTMDDNNINFIKLNSIVTFTYMEATADSVRHPAFKGLRFDSEYENKLTSATK